MSKQEGGDSSIRVICRMRPLNKLEIDQGGQCCLTYNENSINCKISGEEQPHQFSFDRIFGPVSTQREVFDCVAKPVIDSVFNGYNGTIFCYGQTSSGKTHTMEGPSHDDLEQKGLIPRMMDRVFEIIAGASVDIEFMIFASFLEIYNEKIHDLIDSSKQNLQIKEDKIKGIFVQDASEVLVPNAKILMEVMKTGAQNRTIAATRMNERSSRSHSLFYLQVIQKNGQTGTTKQSKLYFVDLAGSEKIAKTLVTGQQLEEAKNINKSLTCLGMVINALTSDKKEHVPYRDSKLTRILQESLGGNAKTTLIINCSMCSYNDKETLSTLRFGARAKNIKNKPKINEEKSAKELMLLLEKAESRIKQQDELIQDLQKQIQLEPMSNQILNKSHSVANIKNHIEQQSQQKQETNQPQQQQQKPVAQSNQNTLKIIQQLHEINDLKNKIFNLEQEREKIELDLSNKTQELNEIQEKYKNLEENNLNQIQQEQNNNRKLAQELQKGSSQVEDLQKYINLFKVNFQRLKTDLEYFLLSFDLKNYDQENTGNLAVNKDEAEILNYQSIQKALLTLKELDDIFKYDEIIDFSAIQDSTKDRRIQTLVEDHYDDMLSQDNKLAKSCENLDNIDNLSTEPKTIQDQRCQTEESITDNYLTQIKQYEMLDGFEEKYCNDQSEIENLLNNLNDEITNDDKILQYQNIVSQRNKYISNLKQQNQQLSQTVENCTKMFDQLKKKLQIVKANQFKKLKELEHKNIELTEDIKKRKIDIASEKAKFEVELRSKQQLITEYRAKIEHLNKNISLNQPLQKIVELEQRIRELGSERQKHFNELFSLRCELDSKEKQLTQKNKEIQDMKVNLKQKIQSSPTQQYVNNNNFITSTSPRATVIERKYFKSNQKNTSIPIQLKSLIKSTIRGGGQQVEPSGNYIIPSSGGVNESGEIECYSQLSGQKQQQIDEDQFQSIQQQLQNKVNVQQFDLNKVKQEINLEYKQNNTFINSNTLQNSNQKCIQKSHSSKKDQKIDEEDDDELDLNDSINSDNNEIEKKQKFNNFSKLHSKPEEKTLLQYLNFQQII